MKSAADDGKDGQAARIGQHGWMSSDMGFCVPVTTDLCGTATLRKSRVRRSQVVWKMEGPTE